MSERTLFNTVLTSARWLLAIVLGCAFITEAWLSLAWRMGTDSPLLHYVAFLIDQHGFVPYRDVFETSMPGTFLFHLGLVKLVGYSEFAFRVTDVVMLAVAMLLAWLTVSQISRFAATIGVLGFALLYLGYAIDLQRDWVGFIAVLGALYAATRQYSKQWLGALLIGALCGLAATIKPHLAIGGPPLLVYHALLLTRTGQQPLLKTLLIQFAIAGVALACCLALPLLWLFNNGGLASFWEMLTAYLPLHVDMTGNIETVTPDEKLQYYRKKLARDLPFWIVPAGFGITIALSAGNLRRQQKTLVWLLAALAVSYIIYTILASQFWLYHWLPFRVLAILCTALMLIPLRPFAGRLAAEALLLTLFCICLTTWTGTLDLYRFRLKAPYAFADQLRGNPPPLRKQGRIDAIAAFLRAADLQPADRVQPLDWTEGALHGMLLAKAVIATPYLYNYHFYHYVSDPYIQEIRRRFIRQLQEQPPRFLIETDDELRPAGLDTTTRFAALEAFIAANYTVAMEGKQYRIYERRQPAVNDPDL